MILSAGLLLVSGCIKVNLEINVNEDGSGTYGGEFAISKVFRREFFRGRSEFLLR